MRTGDPRAGAASMVAAGAPRPPSPRTSVPDPTTATPDTTDLVPEPLARPGRFGAVRRPLRAGVAHRRRSTSSTRPARRPRSTPSSSTSWPELHRTYTGRPTHHHRGAAVRRARRRGAHHPQARGPQPHRLAQDQQRARPGAAHQADRQDPGHRRDRRRPARRRHGHRGRPVRPRLHGLHGRGRHRAPGAQRRADAAARRRGRAGRARQRARSRTPSTRRCATGSPTSRPRTTSSAPSPARTRSPTMVRDFHKIIGEEARGQVLELTGRLPDAVIACVGGGSNAIGIFHALPRRCRGAPRTASRPAATGIETGPARGAIAPRHAPACCTARAATCCRTTTARPSSRTRSPPGLDYPGVGPEHAWLARQRPRRVPSVTDDRGHGGVPPAEPHRGHHPGHRVGARPGRAPWRSAGARPGRRPPGQPVGSRRQGHGDRRRSTSGSRPERVVVTHHGARGRARCCAACREEGRAALVGYLPVGFPTVDGSIEAMRALVENGVDVVEVGLPYTDPVMDGPVIQHAAATALAGGFRVDDVFRAVGGGPRRPAPPVLVMTYWNPVMRYGVDAVRRRPGRARGRRADHARPHPGGGGRVDRRQRRARPRPGLPRRAVVDPGTAHQGDPRRAAASSTPRRRWASPAPAPASTVTPAPSSSAPGWSPTCRSASGSGCSTGAQAAELAAYADGVIVGSALVATLSGPGELGDRLDALRALTTELAEGVRTKR